MYKILNFKNTEKFSNMIRFIIYFFLMTFLGVECQDNVPDIYYSCARDGLLITASFPKPFHGTIFAKGYYAVPNCSTPNMASPITEEVQLNLPLLECGTKVRRRSRSLVENTISIQYHYMLTTVFDYSVNITCRLQEHLPSEFWNLYRQRQQKTNSKYNSWVQFKLGKEVFGEKESLLLGVSRKLFLLVYVKDGGLNKHALVDKCIAHRDRIVNEKTPVTVLNKAERCPADSLSEFSLVANSSVSDLLAFAEVQLSNITSEEFYITCALELCKEVCVQPCRFGMETSRWSTVSTHKIEKRALGIPDQEALDSVIKNSVKSSVKALKSKLGRLRSLIARREIELRISKTTHSSNTPFTTSEEILMTKSTLPKIDRQGRVFSLKLDMPFEDSEFDNLTHTSKAISESASKAVNCSYCMLVNASDVNCSDCMPVEVSAVNCSDCMPVNASAEEDSYNTTQTTTTQTKGTFYPQDLLSNASTTVDIFVEYINGTEQYSNDTSNCVPKFKFISVTASLSFLTVCFFLICVVLILHLRKERKKHLLDSYLLYNFY